MRENEKGPDVLDSEIEQAIDDPKTGKAEGVDGIPAEMPNVLDPQASQLLHRLCRAMYLNEEWPEDFLSSTIVPLQKKPNAQRCKDH